MDDRQRLIDPSTFEVLHEIYTILATADGDGRLAVTDISYMAGQLKAVLLLNSLPAVDPRSDPKIMDSIKKLGRALTPGGPL